MIVRSRLLMEEYDGQQATNKEGWMEKHPFRSDTYRIYTLVAEIRFKL